MSEPVLLKGKPKFCRDCKHVAVIGAAYDLAKCHHPKALKPATEYLVSGNKEPDDYLYASSMRVGSCGEEGKLFEAKTS